MDKVCIQGEKQLNGTVHISGAKNACMAMLAASLLTEDVCILRNVPDLRDVRFFIQLLETLGVKVEKLSPGEWKLQAANITHEASYDLVRQMRASVCIMGPLVGRLHKVSLPLPGGCVIGNRPIDLHLYGLQKLGCKISMNNGIIHVTADQLRGNSIFLGGRFGSTVTGTANLVMAATLTPGTTIIESAACEPEIVDLCKLLQQMGASIEGIGSPRITIVGQKQLRGFDYTVIGDRIEAGTFLIAGLITNGHLKIDQFCPEHLGALLHILEEIGGKFTIDTHHNSVEIFPCLDQLKPFHTTTLPYPGFPTDLQAQMCVLGLCIPGLSLITERIYPQRFMHVAELQRLGGNIILENSTAILQGPSRFSGADVMASDLRASAALYLAGLVSKGETFIHRVYHLDRGYENFDQKLNQLGASIKRIPDNS